MMLARKLPTKFLLLAPKWRCPNKVGLLIGSDDA